MSNFNWNDDLRYFQSEYKQNRKIEKIYIITTVYGYTIATILMEYFKLQNISSLIKTTQLTPEFVNNTKDTDYFFIIFPHEIHFLLPKHKCFLYQLEQINTESKYNSFMKPLLINNIKQSIHTFDYSNDNISTYPSNIKQKIIYLPPPCKTIPKTLNILKPIYDILFYGTLNFRRKTILNHLQKYFNVYIVTNLFDKTLETCIQKCKIVLNLHYFDNPCLETLRINQALPFNKPIISEGKNLSNAYIYKNYVTFIDYIHKDLSNVNILIDKINKVIHDKPNNKLLINKLNNKFENKLKYAYIQNYPYLFHKYILNINTLNTPIHYSIIQKSKCKNQIAHLHCYDMNLFNHIYKDYFNNIKEFYDIIITYHKGPLILIKDATILQIPNVGMDIGAKYCMIQYLLDNKIPYENILFLHSKSNDALRYAYFNTLVGTKETIKMNQHISKLHHAIFPDNLSLQGDFNLGYFHINNLYVQEILKFLNVPMNTQTFVQGNCMIFNKKIIDFVFTDHLNLFYNILNNEYSFDYNYVNQLYKLNNDDIYDVFQSYKKKSHTPNHLYARKTINNYFQDGAIEHAFERIYINIIMHLKGTFHFSSKIKNTKKIPYHVIKPKKKCNETTFSIIHSKTCNYCNSEQKDCIVLYQPNYHVSLKLIKLMNKIIIHISKESDILNNINKTYCSKYIFVIKKPTILKLFKARTYNNLKIIINIKNPILTNIQELFKKHHNSINTIDDIQTLFNEHSYDNIFTFDKWFQDTTKIFGKHFLFKKSRIYDDKSYCWWSILSNIIPKHDTQICKYKKRTIHINNDIYNIFKFNYIISDKNKSLIANSPYLKHFYKPKEILKIINPSE